MVSGQQAQIGRKRTGGTTTKTGSTSVPYSFPFPVLKYKAVERALFLIGNKTICPGVMSLFVLSVLPGIQVPQGLPFQRKGIANAPDQC